MLPEFLLLSHSLEQFQAHHEYERGRLRSPSNRGEMMKKIYSINGKLYRYTEGNQPEGAVEVKAEKVVETKAVKKPANKAKGVSNK